LMSRFDFMLTCLPQWPLVSGCFASLMFAHLSQFPCWCWCVCMCTV
jgi:hypothetical protein